MPLRRGAATALMTATFCFALSACGRKTPEVSDNVESVSLNDTAAADAAADAAGANDAAENRSFEGGHHAHAGEPGGEGGDANGVARAEGTDGLRPADPVSVRVAPPQAPLRAPVVEPGPIRLTPPPVRVEPVRGPERPYVPPPRPIR